VGGEPGTVVKPGAIEFGPGFHNGEAQQAVASVEETPPGRVHVEASAVTSLGRRLPVTEDANIDPATNPKTITYAVVDGNTTGPIKTPQITVPFFASWPSANSSTGLAGRLNPHYQQMTEILSRANSTYEAAILRVTRNSRDGLTLHGSRPIAAGSASSLALHARCIVAMRQCSDEVGAAPRRSMRALSTEAVAPCSAR
jgi:hypothetical protein